MDFEPALLRLSQTITPLHRVVTNNGEDGVALAGLRQAYVSGAESGVIETLTLRRQLYFPRRRVGRAGVFRFPAGVAAVVTNSGEVRGDGTADVDTPEIARLFLDGRRWDALQRSGPSDTHFLTPLTIVTPYDEVLAVLREIEQERAMRPSLGAMSIARNGERFFFNATLMRLIRRGELAVRAPDAVYGEIAARTSAGRYNRGLREAHSEAHWMGFCYVLWAAEALTLPLRLGVFYSSDDAVLRRYIRCVQAAVRSENPLRLVPPMLEFGAFLTVGGGPAVAVVCDVLFDADGATREYGVMLAIAGGGGRLARVVRERDVSGALLPVAALDADRQLINSGGAGAVVAIGVKDGAWVTVRDGVATAIPPALAF